jgi:hypothetical protein
MTENRLEDDTLHTHERYDLLLYNPCVYYGKITSHYEWMMAQFTRVLFKESTQHQHQLYMEGNHVEDFDNALQQYSNVRGGSPYVSTLSTFLLNSSKK